MMKYLRLSGILCLLTMSIGLAMVKDTDVYQDLTYKDQVAPMGAGVYTYSDARREIERIASDEQVILVLEGDLWNDFQRPTYLHVVSQYDPTAQFEPVDFQSKDDARVKALAKFPGDPRSIFTLKRQSIPSSQDSWLGFRFIMGQDMVLSGYLSARGNLVEISPDLASTSKPASDQVLTDAQSWGFYPFDDLTAPGYTRKLQNKATSGFFRTELDGDATTSFQDIWPSAPKEGAIIRIVRLADLAGIISANDADNKLIPGRSSFVYFPGIHNYRVPSFTKDWALGTSGNGSIVFKAAPVNDLTPLQDIRVMFSANTQNDMNTLLYCVSIGENGNQQSAIRSSAGSRARPDNPVSVDTPLALNNAPQAHIDNPQAENYFWVAINDGEVRWGKGQNVGTNTIMTWKDANMPLKDLQYVMLGGLDTAIAFSDIQISKPVDTPVPVQLPDGFVPKAAEILQSVSVGSFNGMLDVWAVEAGKLVRWANDAFIGHTPVGIDSAITFAQVSVAGDGTVYALSTDGHLYTHNRETGNWSPISAAIWSATKAGFLQSELLVGAVSVGHSENVWVIEKDTSNLYQLMTAKLSTGESASAWVLRSPYVIGITAGLDNTAVALNNQGGVNLFSNDRWIDISGGMVFHDIAMVTRDHMMAVGRDLKLYEYKSGALNDAGIYVPGTWTAIAADSGMPSSGLDKIAANAAGTIALIDANGKFYLKGTDGLTDSVIDTLKKSAPVNPAPGSFVEIAPSANFDSFIQQMQGLLGQIPTLAAGMTVDNIPQLQQLGAQIAAKITDAITVIQDNAKGSGDTQEPQPTPTTTTGGTTPPPSPTLPAPTPIPGVTPLPVAPKPTPTPGTGGIPIRTPITSPGRTGGRGGSTGGSVRGGSTGRTGGRGGSTGGSVRGGSTGGSVRGGSTRGSVRGGSTGRGTGRASNVQLGRGSTNTAARSGRGGNAAPARGGSQVRGNAAPARGGSQARSSAAPARSSASSVRAGSSARPRR